MCNTHISHRDASVYHAERQLLVNSTRKIVRVVTVLKIPTVKGGQTYVVTTQSNPNLFSDCS